MKTKDSTFFNSLNSSISVSQTDLFLYIEIRQRVMRNDFKTEFLKFFENLETLSVDDDDDENERFDVSHSLTICDF